MTFKHIILLAAALCAFSCIKHRNPCNCLDDLIDSDETEVAEPDTPSLNEVRFRFSAGGEGIPSTVFVSAFVEGDYTPLFVNEPFDLDGDEYTGTVGFDFDSSKKIRFLAVAGTGITPLTESPSYVFKTAPGNTVFEAVTDFMETDDESIVQLDFVPSTASVRIDWNGFEYTDEVVSSAIGPLVTEGKKEIGAEPWEAMRSSEIDFPGEGYTELIPQTMPQKSRLLITLSGEDRQYVVDLENGAYAAGKKYSIKTKDAWKYYSYTVTF